MNYLKSEILQNNNLEKTAGIAAKGLGNYLEYYAELRKENFAEIFAACAKYNIFSVRGADGSGKSSFKKIIRNSLSDGVITFEYNCSNMTELDDIFLKLYKFILLNPLKHELFRTAKAASPNQSVDEQILYYLKNSDGNLALFFDNFESLLDDNGEFRGNNVKSFFEFLATLKEIKVFIFSSVNLNAVIDFPENVHFSTRLNSIDDDEVKNFFSAFDIEVPNSVLPQICDLTSGHVFSLKFLAMATKVLDLPISEIIRECNQKHQEINQFIAKKLMVKLSNDTKKALYYAVFFRHDITQDILDTIDNFDDANADVNLLKNYMLLDGENSFEIKDFLRKMLYDNFPAKEKIKIHDKIADFYANQIPLKPEERAVEISRTSMYSEKFYHYNTKTKLMNSLEMKSVTSEDTKQASSDSLNTEKYKYITSSKYLPDFPVKAADDAGEDDLSAVNIDICEKDLNLSDAENAVIDDISTEKYYSDNSHLIKQNKDGEFIRIHAFKPKKKIDDGFVEIRDADDKKSNAENFIYKANTALIEDKIDEAIECYNAAIQLYSDIDKNSCVKTQLELVRVLVDAYRYDSAKKILCELYDEDEVSATQVDVLIEMATISERQNNTNKALDCYSKAINCALDLDIPALIANVYFKMALLFDDANDIDNALEYYLLAAYEAEEQENVTVLASAYSNIASIYEDKNDLAKALDYYKKSLKEDEKTSDFDGIAKSYSAIGNIFLKRHEPKIAIKAFIKEVSVAKLTNDSYLMASAYLELGDTWLSLQNYKEALKAYLLAKKNIDSTISTDSKNKIVRRFDLIVDEIGESAYRFLLKELSNR